MMRSEQRYAGFLSKLFGLGEVVRSSKARVQQVARSAALLLAAAFTFGTIATSTPANATAWEFSHANTNQNGPYCAAETVVDEKAVGFRAVPGGEMWAYADGFAVEGSHRWEISGAGTYELETVWSPGDALFIAQNIPLRMFGDLISGKALSVRSDSGQTLRIPLQGSAEAIAKFIACYTGLATLEDFLDRGPGGTLTSMFAIAGECKVFHIANQPYDCAPGIYRNTYDTGAVSFSGLSDERKLAVAFIGKPGVRTFQGKLIQSVQMLAIQPLDGNDPMYTAAIGSCTYDGFMGKGQQNRPASIVCFATDGDGRTFILNFEKNADAPRDVTE